MNFALLGCDPSVQPLLEAISLSRDHRVTAILSRNDLPAAVRNACPDAHVKQQWPELIADSGVDAVILASRDDEAVEATRQLAAPEFPLIVLPLAGIGLETAYELSLIRDDSQVLLVPALERRSHPRVRELIERIRTGAVGRLRQIEFERSVDCRDRTSRLLPTGTDSDDLIFEDIDLLRHIGGNYDSVTRMHSGATDDGIADINITLTGDHLPDAALSLRSGTESNWALRLRGDDGTLELTGTGSFNVDGTESSIAVTFLDHFDRAVAGQPNDLAAWTELIRACETVDAGHRSIRRRRTIDLHFEATSERSMFKTQMAAIGCGVLTWTLFGAVAYLVIAAAVELPTWVLHVARGVWILPLVVFLGLQFLLVIARPAGGDAESNSAG